uniref:Ig-like domain-containing protein n=1 Tax=Astyanax mexicanus TaxID=7994 RepID=A0A3B1IEX5_ASTMX
INLTITSLQSLLISLSHLCQYKASLTLDPDSTVFTGESVTLKCEITGNWRWRYQWYNKRGDRWSAVSQSGFYTVNSTTLTIRVNAVINGDQYWCRGESDSRPTSSQDSNKVTLTVRDNHNATLTIKPNNHVFSGETVTLRCDIQGGGDTEWTYSWFKNDTIVHTSNTSEEYRISSVTLTDSGKYTCRQDRSDNTTLKINDAVTLTVSAEAQAVLSVSPQNWLTEGDSVTLSCEVRDSSTGWNFSWYTDNDKLLSDSSRGSGGSYTLSSAALKNTGVYLCRAERGEPAYHTQYSNPQPLWITASFSVLHLLSFLMAASPYLLSTIILGVKSYRAGAPFSPK